MILTEKLYEPLCWNCARVQRLETFFGSTVYIPCELYYKNQPCNHIPYARKRCVECYNFDLDSGCAYDVTLNDSKCVFKPLTDKPECEYPHREIRCPLVNIPYDGVDYGKIPQCRGNTEICSDCPIDWTKLRLVKTKDEFGTQYVQKTRKYDWNDFSERPDDEPDSSSW